MEFKIEVIYEDGRGSIGVSSHEPDDSFYMYKLNEGIIDNSETRPNKSSFYPFRYPVKDSPQAITTLEVDEFGVKNSIGWGAGAYYHPIGSDYTYVMLPLHRFIKPKPAPNVTLTQDGNKITVDVSTLSGTKYECARIVAEQGNVKMEQVEYFKDGVIRFEMGVGVYWQGYALGTIVFK